MSEIRDSLNVLGVSTLLNTTIDGERFIVPRLTTAQRNAMATPVAGLLIFNITTNSLETYTGLVWFQYAYNGTNNAVPIGFCGMIFSNTIPAGYLELNGQTFNQAIYPELFVQNGNSNVLPNMRGKFARGAGVANDGILVDGTNYNSTTVKTLQQHMFASHRHFVNIGDGFTGSWQGHTYIPNVPIGYSATGNTNGTLTLFEGGVETRSHNLGVVFIIKATV